MIVKQKGKFLNFPSDVTYVSELYVRRDVRF